MSKELFLDFIKVVGNKYKSKGNLKKVKLISHLDADGISSAALLTKIFKPRSSIFSTSILNQLRTEDIESMKDGFFDLYVFSDLGSGQIDRIRKFLPDKNILILDHHECVELTKEEEELKDGKFDNYLKENIIQVNPHMFGIDGGREISGAGVCFLFSLVIDKKMSKLSYIPLIGAVGDVQDSDGGFVSINKDILEMSIKEGLVEVKKDLRLFGIYSKPLIMLLQNVQDPLIPYSSEKFQKTMNFLEGMGIKMKEGNRFRYYYELSDEEKKKLEMGILMTRKDCKNPSDIYSTHYIIKSEKEESAFKSIKEFATLLNGCGRLGKPEYGLYACLNDKKMKVEASKLIKTYKTDLVHYLNWVKKVRSENNKEFVYDSDKYLIINGKEEILHTMVGTLASILSKSKDFPKGKVLMTMARTPKKYLKISLRTTGNHNLREIFNEIFKNFDYGEYGGHVSASGAIVPLDKEEEFLNRSIEVLSKI
ncbi:MAG: DHH family phosphoesterase [Candidatus Nanoarchaeia archaeon]|nr:DHH family phosphoesterase [Candidatus Nanoarchaeia archaeon]